MDLTNEEQNPTDNPRSNYYLVNSDNRHLN